MAAFARRIGLLAILQRVPKRPSLIVLNYHRVTASWHTVADRGLVEATPDDLLLQMSWIKRHFHVATLQEAQRFVDTPSRVRSPLVLITFDDGYRDNYDVAFPILRSLALPATFFLVTSFVGSRSMPWWDRIADMVRRRAPASIHLDYPRSTRITGSTEQMIQSVLRLYKDPATVDVERFLSALETACGLHYIAETEERLFFDWDEAREMLNAGMSFGSHTHRHELLAKQHESRQREEIGLSRDMIQEHLGIACDALAYPVGSPTSFSIETQRLLSELGYRTAFSYFGGVNLPSRIERFNVLRAPIDPQLGLEGYRMRALVSAIVGKNWP